VAGAGVRDSRRLLLEVLETIVLTLLIFVGVQTFVAQPFKVEGGSMETTLLPHEFVLVDKLTPRWSPYVRGDIVVLDPPDSAGGDGTPFIKRVIGVAGDVITLADGAVSVNGQALDEPYVFGHDGMPESTDPTPGGLTEWHVAEGQLIVLGDHRQASADSRLFGPVEVSHVIGRAWIRYWPLEVFGVIPGQPAT
jgi:signal peptidase I